MKIRTKSWTGDQQVSWESGPQFGEGGTKIWNFTVDFLPHFEIGYSTAKNRIVQT